MSSSMSEGECKQPVAEGADTRPRLYFAKMDMQSAFDTVKQDKMLEVMERILEKVCNVETIGS